MSEEETGYDVGKVREAVKAMTAEIPLQWMKGHAATKEQASRWMASMQALGVSESDAKLLIVLSEVMRANIGTEDNDLHAAHLCAALGECMERTVERIADRIMRTIVPGPRLEGCVIPVSFVEKTR